MIFRSLKKVLASLLPEKNIGKNALIYSLGTYSSKLISLIIFPIIAVELGLVDTGKYDLILSTVTILVPIFSLQMGDVAYRWLSDSNERQKGIGVTITIVLLIPMTILLGALTVFVWLQYNDPLLWGGSLILMSQILLSSMMQIVRGNRQVNLYTYATIIRSVVFTMGGLYAVFFTDAKLPNLLASFAISNFLVLTICVWKGLRKSQFSLTHLNLENIKEVLKYVYPLVFNALGWMLLINVNKYIISANLGYEMNGIFAIADKLATPIYFLGIFYFFSAQDHFLNMTDFSARKESFKLLIKKVSLIMTIGIVGLVIGAYLLIPLLFQGLIEGIEFLPWLAAINFFIIMAIYMGIPYTYDKQSLALASTTILGILCTIILSFLLIDPLGLYGVCAAILLGSFLILILRIRFVKSFFQNS
ncbi:O-antigen/teichoic acid export membrane protein [Roseivirga ehrenbergii]|nr:O-antigen/teichoic acid export membrane protein [Roseivirga ehrenbergii]